MEGTTTALTGAVGEIITLTTDKLLPLALTSPFVYIFAGTIIAIGIGVIAHLRHAV